MNVSDETRARFWAEGRRLALYEEVYAERFGEPPLHELPPTDETDLADALAATESERARRRRDGSRVP